MYNENKKARPLIIVKDAGRRLQHSRSAPTWEPAGVEVSTGLFDRKVTKRKHGARLHVCGYYRLALSGSGYPQKIRGFDVRKAKPEDTAAVDELDRQIEELEKRKREAIERAFENGEPLHASDASNYKAGE